MDSLSTELAALRSELKNLAKLVRKVRAHQEDPTGEKAKNRTRNNGFNRKMEVTDKLKAFLELADDEFVSRSDVTRRINKYIKDNGLKHPDNGRIIIMDEKLAGLLSPPDGEQVTFLNMQKFISPHYLKPADVVPETPTAVEEAVANPVAKPEEDTVKPPVKRPTIRKPKT